MKSLICGCLVGLASVGAASTLRQAQSLVLVDNVGRTIGPVSDLSSFERVYYQGPRFFFAFDDTVFSVRASATRAGFEAWDADFRFFYVSNDCTGQAYMYDGLIESVAVVAAPGQTVYVGDRSAPAQLLTFGSTRYTNGNCDRFGMATTLRPAIPLLNLLDYFTPPFHYEVGCDNACGYEAVTGSGGAGVIRLGEEKARQ